MPIIHEFEYFKPDNVKDALKLLAKFKKPSILAGGTDLINNLKLEVDQPDAVVDIKGIKTLRSISFKKDVLTVGATVTFTDLIDSKLVRLKFPVIIETARTVGSVGVRNRATMVGNICSAVACADSSPLLLAYEAIVIVQSKSGKRKIPIEKWFKANKQTALKSGEMVLAVEIPLPANNHAGCFVKMGRYTGEDLAQASVVVLALPENKYRVTFGSVGPVPMRAGKIEKIINGKELTPELIAQAKKLIPTIIQPISDVRASKEYRLHMSLVMFERGLRAAAARLNGSGPRYGKNVI
jgi:CO/xanthine dehydrogenase FAD-binding subunit